MTGNTSKSRAVFLAALMVFSVFAGTVAFTGSAAAQEYAGGAVHYNNSSTANWTIEIPVQDGTLDPADVNSSNVTVLVDGDEQSGVVNWTASTQESTSSPDSTIHLNMTRRIASNDIEVELSNNFPNSLQGTYSVAFAAESYDLGDGISGYENTTYQGTTVAYYNTSTSDFPVEGTADDNNYFQSFSAGTNSTVFYIDTSNLDVDTYDLDDGTANLTVRDLGLSVSVDDTNITTEDSLEGTVEARASGRSVDIEILDSNGDVVDPAGGSITRDLSGQGEYDFSFDVSENDLNLDTGDYTVRVTDTGSGVEVESSTVTISEAADDDADFATNTITDQRGDVVEFTVTMDSTDFATVVLGSPSDGTVSNVTVEDGDGDGQVTVYANTHAIGTGSGKVYSLDSDSDDSIESQDLGEGTDNLIDAGEYDMDVRPGKDATVDSTGVATLILEDRGTSEINTWTLPSGVSVSDIEGINEAIADGELTQSDEIANGDKIVHAVHATGLEGNLSAQHNEDITTEFFSGRGTNYNFTVEQTDAGANQDPWQLLLGSQNTTVVADGDNDTYYFVVDTGANTTGPSAIPDDEGLTANFTVIQDDLSADGDFTNDDEYDDDENEETLVDYEVVEPTISVDEPYNVSQASGQTVSGTTSLAPGTELNLRIRSTDGTSPSFLKTASPVVQSDGSWSATFDFSGQSVGDTYEIVVDDGSGGADKVTEDGTVVEQMMTDTATPEPDTATPEPDTATPEPDTATPEPDTATPAPDTDTPTSTPTSTPGFGVVVALTALVAAALLAIRRD